MENFTTSTAPSTTSTATKDLTTAYYILSSVFQGLAFLVGTLYVLRRDYLHHEEERLKEWRKFSEELNLKYIDMIRDKVIQRLQHANESLKVRISPDINGLDVLRYMINDDDRFPNTIEDGRSVFPGIEQTFKPTALGELRLDLRRVFVLLNYCWSLCLLGKIPENFKNEMERIVIVLGKLAFPFYSEELYEPHRFTIIKGCLEKFGVTPTELKDMKELTIKLPYLHLLQYKPNMETGKIFTFKTDVLFSHAEPFLITLHHDLVESNSAADYALRFAKKMKEKKSEWIGENATDESMVLKLIHNVRCIAWKTTSPPLDTEDDDLRKALEAVWKSKEVPPFLLDQEVVKGLITRFKQDLETFFERDGYKNFKYLKNRLNLLQDELKNSKIPEFDKLRPFCVRVVSITV